MRRPIPDYVVSCWTMINTQSKERSYEQVKLDRSLIEYNCKYIKKFWLKLFQLWDSFGSSVNKIVIDLDGSDQQQSLSYGELDTA